MNPFEHQDVTVAGAFYVATFQAAAWLHANGYENVHVQSQHLVPDTILLVSDPPHRADEACYAITASEVCSPDTQFVDIDEFARILLSQQRHELLRFRTHSFGPVAWLWRVVYWVWPGFGRLP